MRLPEFASTASYISEKIKQATGYQAYLDTFDNLDKIPGPLSAIAGGLIGAFSFSAPSSIRLRKEMYNRKLGFKGYLLAGGCWLADFIIGFEAPYHLSQIGLSILPQETQQLISQLPLEVLRPSGYGVLLTSKLIANSLIHTGIDALQRKTSLLKI